jgi:enediyne polyketide synthase
LNSITVRELVLEAARHLGLSAPTSPTDFADATITEIAEALDELRLNPELSTGLDDSVLPAGVDSWIKSFTVELVERPISQRIATGEAGAWEVISLPDHPLADELRVRFDQQPGGGVIVCLPANCDEGVVGLLLTTARAVLRRSGNSNLVMVQHGNGAAAFARTLHLEAPHVTTCVVNVPESHPQTIEWILAEV